MSTARDPRPQARTRVLLVGPLPHPGDVIGGTKVSFGRLAEALRRSPGFEIALVDTARARAGSGAFGRTLADAAALARVGVALLARARRGTVVLVNASSRGLLALGPLAWLACGLRGARLAVRVFGGDLDQVLERAPAPLRALARRTFLRAPLLLLQTRALCQAFGRDAACRWLPTTRDAQPLDPEERAERAPARRFVYVGQLRPEKGLREALAASDALPPEARLELYGPALPGFDPALLEGHPRARHGGVLRPDEVEGVLARCDALVFPSYHPGEGLPGTVVEALQCGLPVVAARWRGLPELVEDGRNGLLVAPRSADELRAALLRLARDGELACELARGARASGELYREARWQPQLEAWLHELARRSPGTPAAAGAEEGPI